MTRRCIGLLVTPAFGLLVVSLAAEAQPAGKVYRIAFLSAGSPTRPSLPTHMLDAFRQRLHELGWFQGQNIGVEYRWAEWRFERLPTLAAELVQLQVDLILVGTGLELLAAKQATRTIPIVMVFSLDAIEQGFVTSLAHPGADVTGVTTMTAVLNQKRLELPQETVPGSSRMTALTCKDPAPGQDLPKTPDPAGQGWGAMQRTARALGVHLQRLEVREPDDYDGAFAAAIRERAEAMVVFACYFNAFNWLRVMSLAAEHRLPAIYHSREWVQAGGLLSYRPSLPDLARRAATYVDKILKAAKPADLPVEQPMKFDLVINLKTAQALGLTIPPSLLFQATEVIRYTCHHPSQSKVGLTPHRSKGCCDSVG
jgi:putative tryptophan/tyrosine transport system substrate-binding protein